MRHLLTFLSLGLLSTIPLEAADKPFLGAIPVQYASPNEEVLLDMHRFLHPPGQKLKIAPAEGVEARFDSAAFELRARATKPGLYDVELRAGQDLRSILTLVVGGSAGKHRFSFKPDGKPGKVFVAGAFNGWSSDKTAMIGPDAEGSYAVEVALKPGRNPYKFVVDGKWMLDPANPESEDDGGGNKNSILSMKEAAAASPPSIFADRLTPNALVVHVTAPGAALERVSAVLETDAGARSLRVKTSPNEAEIALPGGEKGFVRVVASDASGQASNVVRCPVPNENKFRWQDGVLYYAFTDRFVDGDAANNAPVKNDKVAAPANYHGGDLRGITQKIRDGYFEKLSANTIWVAPLNRNPARAYQEYPEPHRWYTGYHGYWPVSSTELDPHIGNAKDLHQLVETAHERGLKVIADLVLHHVHEEHPWWKEHRDWFGSLDLPDGRKNLRLWDEQQFTTWFEPYLPSFDFSKDAPVRALIDNSIWWANTYKLDGFRLDAVKHILPSFWWKFRAALRERVPRPKDSPLYLVGETFKDRAGIMSFVGPNMLDGQFDFPLYDQIKDTFGSATADLKALEEALAASERVYGKETLMSPLVGNHDKGRFMAYADGDLPKGEMKEEEVGWNSPPKVDETRNYAKLQLAQAFLMSIDGVPMIYYGDEIGMTGAGDPDNRRDMRFGDKVSPDENRVLENFTKLGKLRREHPALRHGSRRTVLSEPDVFAFVRAHLDDRVVAIFNRGSNQARLELEVAPELPDGDYVEVLSGRSLKIENGKLQIAVAPQLAAFVTRKAP